MTAPRERLRIVIAEDAAIMRDGLTQTLTRRGHDVVAAVPDAEALRLAVEEHRPDVAIIDVRMPPTHTDEGLRAAQAIHRDHPEVGVLVFSQYIETQAATELFAHTWDPVVLAGLRTGPRRRAELLTAIADYQKRDRRFGGLSTNTEPDEPKFDLPDFDAEPEDASEEIAVSSQ